MTDFPTTIDLLHCHQVLEALNIADIELLADYQSHRQTLSVRFNANPFFNPLSEHNFHLAVHIRSGVLETWQQAREKEEERLRNRVERRTTDVSTPLQDLPNPVQSRRELVPATILVEQAQGIATLSRIDSVLVLCKVGLREQR